MTGKFDKRVKALLEYEKFNPEKAIDDEAARIAAAAQDRSMSAKAARALAGTVPVLGNKIKAEREVEKLMQQKNQAIRKKVIPKLQSDINAINAYDPS